MTPTQADELLRTLKGKAFTLEDLHERVRMSGSAWSLDQVRLFLLCAPYIQHNVAADTFHIAQRGGREDELQDAILAAVRSFAGKPVPATQIRARLLNHLVITDEQIRAIAKRTPGLQLVGPGLITTGKGG